MQRFTDKVAVITGAGSGLGRACALRLAEEGAHVAVTGPILDEVEAVAADIAGLDLGRKVLPLLVDVTDESTVAAMIESVVHELGPIDCAVNNAGVSPPSMLSGDYDQDVWDHTVNVNMRGTFLCLKHELQHMANRPAGSGGSIVNVGSFASFCVPIMGVSPYAASKHAVAGITKAAARDYAGQGIRINAIAPGHMRTAMVTNFFGSNSEAEESIKQRIPLHRIADPAEIAASVAFLLSEDASFVTGTMLTADGGLSI